jgi:glutamate N-acetyltransferase/amino-acid N-acetyltransferase
MFLQLKTYIDMQHVSAGVIGRRMKMEAYIKAIPELPKSLGASADDAHRAAVAITTTDLVSKEAALQASLLHNALQS